MKLSQGMFRLDIRSFFYPEGGWALEQATHESGHSASLREFNKCLDNTLRFLECPVNGQELDMVILMGPFPLNILYDSVKA